MDKEYYKQLAPRIESGEYYKEAMRWYAHIYHSPMPDRCLYMVIVMFCAFISLVNISSYMDLSDDLVPIVPFVYENQNVDKYIPRMMRLASPGEGTQLALSRFLVKDYVRAREEYDPTQPYMVNDGRIRALSDRKTQVAYRRQMDLNNPNSPIILYQKHTKRVIEVLEPQFIFDKSTQKAIIPFYVTLQGQVNKKKTLWTADITFLYKDIIVDNKTGKVTPMEFLVTEYKVQQKPE